LGEHSQFSGNLREMTDEHRLPRGAGSYLLLLRLGRAATLRVGRLGEVAFRRGWYAYIGSALGAGGLRARIGHHCRVADRPHWHIDYLRRAARLDTVWYVQDPRRWECAWAQVLAQWPGVSTPLMGFGASDCQCPAHLFCLPQRPTRGALETAIRAAFPDHPAFRSLRPCSCPAS